MKNLLILLLSSSLVFVACQNDPFEAQKNNSKDSQNSLQQAKAKLAAYYNTYQLNTKIGSLSKPKNTKNSAARMGSINSKSDYDYYNAIAKRLINPDDYECGPTIFDDYIGSIFVGFTAADFALLDYAGVALDYEYVFGNTESGQYFGPNGEYTNPNVSTMKNLKRFWDIPTDIVLRAAHGNIFADESKSLSILLLYGIPQADAQEIAALLKEVFGQSKFRNYNHPILTFNAFAAPEDPYFNTPKKIVMGDGILIAYAEMGFSDVASKQIIAHEYGHHVQFAKNVNFGNSPEATRRTELMADAFSAYYLTHSRGEAMNWKRVKEFLVGFYLIGDCAFNNNGHHGTPNQRMRAAEYGNSLAEAAQKNGKIMTSAEFITKFDAVLPALIAPDAN